MFSCGLYSCKFIHRFRYHNSLVTSCIYSDYTESISKHTTSSITATHAIQNISISFAASGDVCFEAMFAVGSAEQTNGCHVLLIGKENTDFVIDIQIGTHCMTSPPAGNYTVIATDILLNGSIYTEPALITTFEIIGRITHSFSSGTQITTP